MCLMHMEICTSERKLDEEKNKKTKKTEEIKYFDTQRDEKLNIQNGINQHSVCVWREREGGGGGWATRSKEHF